MYYDEEEYLKAVKEYEETEVETSKIKAEVFSFKLGQMPLRSITEKDITIMQKSHDAWDKVLEVGRRPLR